MVIDLAARQETLMSLKDWTPKVAVVGFLGSLITLMIMSALTLFWRHQFIPGVWRLGLAIVLFGIFFRKRRIAFAMVALSFILVVVGMSAPFHPTVIGITVTTVSAVLFYMLAIWLARRYPYLKRTDWKMFFDGDPE